MTSDIPPGYQRYFTEFLPALSGQLLLEDLSDLSVEFGIVLLDIADSCWHIRVTAGRISAITQAGPVPEVCFEADPDTFFRVVSSEESPQTAFFDGRVEIKGDIELGLALSTILEPFFQRFPFQP